ncbi:hypothetical protein Ancab_001799 [Ancistrocladus abbreviatus]
MARKRQGSEKEEQANPVAETANMRVTRSSARRGNQNSTTVDSVAKRRGNVAEEKPPKRSKNAKAASFKGEASMEEEEKPGLDACMENDKKADKKGKTVAEEVEEEDGKVTLGEPKTIIIEHCKQCTSFKKRALAVKDGLEKGVSGITVLVNPEKPRRGCFEIREEDGEVFLSLLVWLKLSFQLMVNA